MKVRILKGFLNTVLLAGPGFSPLFPICGTLWALKCLNYWIFSIWTQVWLSKASLEPLLGNQLVYESPAVPGSCFSLLVPLIPYVNWVGWLTFSQIWLHIWHKMYFWALINVYKNLFFFWYSEKPRRGDLSKLVHKRSLRSNVGRAPHLGFSEFQILSNTLNPTVFKNAKKCVYAHWGKN